MNYKPEVQLACKALLMLLTATFLLINPPCAASEIDEQDVLTKSKAVWTNIVDEGRWDLYLSGYAYHNRNTYNEDRIQKLNEKAWGAGIGKTVRSGKGNDQSLYIMVIRDSNMYPQWMAGYSYQWIHPINIDNKWEVGGGITALLISRHDWFNSVPFPAVLPIASIGTQSAKLMVTYVPHISTQKGKGDVVLLFAKFEFD